MVAVDTSKIKQLREETGAPVMDCKRALEESSGNLDQARQWLRSRGAAIAEKKAGRVASQGLVESYIHGGGRIGVIVEVNCETDFVAKTPEFQALVKDVAMHVAASSPIYVTKEDVPPEVLEKEKEIYRAQAAAQGKPQNVLDKIAEGKLKDYFSQYCLLEQPFIRDGKQTVGQLVQEKIAVIKENIVVRRFARFRVGEETRTEAPPEQTNPVPVG